MAARCYIHSVPPRLPPVPDLLLVSDKRNDAALESALARLPCGSGLVFRHYHLAPAERRRRFRALRRSGIVGIWSGTAAEAQRAGAQGAYGDPLRLARGPRLMRFATAHDLREIGRANRHRADAILLSPVFATRSHPGGETLGPVRFRLLAARSRVPVIALGGMDHARARRLRWRKWAAIQAFAK
ncbi:thiamine phosphate synthase [Novosphingobium aquimarinum]|uniref:thiamine phosphate synthase n=1 Tax=Novosphingobium aquimarinum TaxID=2682494 RepID=UPI001E3D4F19|nr:thiamine phosphate synthase [Novosphingobium aquimarinum]